MSVPHSIIRRSVLALLVSVSALPAKSSLADDKDSSSDSDGGFHRNVERASGLMVRVPIDVHGNENTNEA